MLVSCMMCYIWGVLRILNWWFDFELVDLLFLIIIEVFVGFNSVCIVDGLFLIFLISCLINVLIWMIWFFIWCVWFVGVESFLGRFWFL